MTASRDARTPSIREAFTLYRIVVTLLLSAAVVGIGWAFSEHNEVDAPVVRHSAVAVVEPGENEQALRQDRIFVQLDPKYTGVLFVNGLEIPEDQVNRAAGLNTIEYTPTPDSATGSFEPGVVRARVEFWELTRTRAESSSYQWSFNVA
jgi:hypothetical protein